MHLSQPTDRLLLGSLYRKAGYGAGAAPGSRASVIQQRARFGASAAPSLRHYGRNARPDNKRLEHDAA